MNVARRAVAWLRANVEYLPFAAFLALVVVVQVSFPHLFILLKLVLLVLLAAGSTLAYVILHDGPSIARAAAAKRVPTYEPPTRTVRAYEVGPNHQPVRELPASTYVMDPVPTPLIELEPAIDEAPELPAIVVSAPTAPPRFASLADAPKTIVWPSVTAERVSFREPIVVGVNEDGEWVTVTMLWRNILIAGEPGSGKSSLMSMFVATAALDPAVKLYLFDGGLVDLAPWEKCAEVFVGPDRAHANRMLRKLIEEMERRYEWLRRRGVKKITPSASMPVLFVGMDELAYYTVGVSKEEKDQANEFCGLAADLVRRGRKVGITVVAATQRPSASVIPTELRNLFGFRAAMRVNVRVDSDIALGTGWARQGFDASTIDPSHIGEGFLRHEGATPVRLKACYLDDSDVEAVARRAEQVRAPTGSRPVPDRFPTGSEKGAGTGVLSVEQVAELVPERVWALIDRSGLSVAQIVQGVVGADRRGRAYQEATDLVMEAIRQRAPKPPLKLVREGEEDV